MVSTKKELTHARDTLIFLLQALCFLINKNKSVLHPCQILKFLSVEINSKEMSVSTSKKRATLFHNAKAFLKEKSVSMREMTQVLGIFSSTAFPVLATPLQYRATQRQQIAELANTKNFDSMIVLTDEKSYNG